MMTPEEYWRSGVGIAHITPPGNRSPEGDGFDEVLRDLVGNGVVLDFGCGVGRLAKVFEPDRYLGVDICADAVDIARQMLPWHRFKVLAEGDALPRADVTLIHTVLLHVPDGDPLHALIGRLSSERVVVSEIMGRQWRRGGEPPVFNREATEYGAAFAPAYRLNRIVAHSYPHYRGAELSMMEFVKC